MQTSKPPVIAPPEFATFNSRATPSGLNGKPFNRQLTRRKRNQSRSWANFLRDKKSHVAALKDTPPWLLSLIFHLGFMLLLALITFNSKVGNGILLTFSQGAKVDSLSVVEFGLEPVELDTDSTDNSLAQNHALQEVSLSLPILLPTITSGRAAAANPQHLDELIGAQQQAVGSSNGLSMFSGRIGPMKQALLQRNNRASNLLTTNFLT